MICKLVTRVIQYFSFLGRPVKVGGICEKRPVKGGNVRKGGGGMTPLTNYGFDA